MNKENNLNKFITKFFNYLLVSYTEAQTHDTDKINVTVTTNLFN